MTQSDLLQSALQLDRGEMPVEAIEAYETAVQAPASDLSTWLNLVALYMAVNDYGYASAHRVPKPLVDGSLDRAAALLRLAEERFGHRPEIEFWRWYVPYVALDDQEARARLTDMVRKSPELQHYSLLLGETGEMPTEELTRFIERLKEEGTERARHLVSTMESALRHQRRIL